MELIVSCGRWVVQGYAIPKELDRRSWGDIECARRAINVAGYRLLSSFKIIKES